MDYYDCSPDDFYDDTQVAEACGYIEEADHLKFVSESEEFIRGIIDSVYFTGNIEDLEWNLCELAHLYEIKMKEMKVLLKKI